MPLFNARFLTKYNYKTHTLRFKKGLECCYLRFLEIQNQIIIKFSTAKSIHTYLNSTDSPHTSEIF